MLLGELRDELARAVGRAVVDHDELVQHAGLRQHPSDDLADRPAFVIDRHHDRNFHARTLAEV